jgi:hypothetical protein
MAPGKAEKRLERPNRTLPSGLQLNKVKRKKSCAIYIYKVIKQVYSDTGISSYSTILK